MTCVEEVEKERQRVLRILEEARKQHDVWGSVVGAVLEHIVEDVKAGLEHFRMR